MILTCVGGRAHPYDSYACLSQAMHKKSRCRDPATIHELSRHLKIASTSARLPR